MSDSVRVHEPSSVHPDMVERVGRAIADADDEDYMEDWRRYDARARAAIMAMRDYIPVFRDPRDGGKVHQLVGAPEDIWRTMLDAALGSA